MKYLKLYENFEVSDFIYFAIFLDEDNKTKLLDKFPPVFERIFAHHVTIKFKDKGLHDWESYGYKIGEKVKIKVLGHIVQDGVQAVLVDSKTFKTPHITISLDEEKTPMESSIIMDKYSNKIEKVQNFEIEGTVGFFNKKGKVITSE